MKNSLLLSILIFAALTVKSQNTIQVPQDATTIPLAVQIAQTGDTILLSEGLYTDSVHIMSKELIIKGASNAEVVLSPGINEKSFVLEGSDVKFINLTFDDFDQESPAPNFAISASYANISVDQCEFKNLNSPIYLLEGDLEISNSIFTNVRGGGAVLQVGGTFLIYNNLLNGFDFNAFTFTRCHGYFFNNTLIGSSSNNGNAIFINSDSTSYIFNNIIGEFLKGIFLFASDSTEFEALRINNNNIYNVPYPYRYEYNENLSLPIFSGALTPYPGTGEMSEMPLFVDIINGNFNLQSNSPCIDVGVDDYPFSLENDLNGDTRVIGSYPDLGAYEFSLITGVNKPFGELPNNQLVFYPQPTRDFVHIILENDFSGTIEVMDLSGRILKRVRYFNEQNFSIDLSEFSGLLLLRMRGDGWTRTGRVLKI